MNFNQWLKEVNKIVVSKIGTSIHDMPDLLFLKDYFEDEMTPQDMAEELFETWAAEEDIDLSHLYE